MPALTNILVSGTLKFQCCHQASFVSTSYMMISETFDEGEVILNGLPVSNSHIGAKGLAWSAQMSCSRWVKGSLLTPPVLRAMLVDSRSGVNSEGLRSLLDVSVHSIVLHRGD